MQTTHDLWTSSVARYHERQQREIRARWFSFYSGMAELHRRLADEHEARAEALCREDPPAPAYARDKDGSGPYPEASGEEGEQAVART